jgi:peroxiredoxin
METKKPHPEHRERGSEVMKRLKDWRLWLMVIIGAVGLGSLRASSLRRSQPSASNPPKVGDLAPDFTLTDDNGKTYRLSDFRGKKALLNFFCGCGSCAELAETWEKIHRQFPDTQVLGISTINPDVIRNWCRSLDVTFPTLFDPNYGAAEVYDSTNCPRCWVIDEEGKVDYTSHPQDRPTEVARALRQHLATGTDSHGMGDRRA